MTWTFSLNQAPSGNANAFYRIKEFLKTTLGWTITKSGTGTAGTYNSSGDAITGAGAGAFGTNRAWFVAQGPQGDQLSIQGNGATAARIKYSYSAGFTGGSPDAQTVPSATDELVFVGGGSDASPTTGGVITSSVTNLQMIGDAVTGDFAIVGYISTGGLPGTALVLDHLVPGSYSPSDPCPVVFWSHTAASTWHYQYLANFTGTNPLSRGPSGTVIGTPAMRYADQSATRTPGGMANPFSGEDIVYPIYYGRDANASGVTSTGMKGMSAILKWVGRENIPSGTLGTLDSTKDHIIFNSVALPWDGSTVPANINEKLLADVSDTVRGYVCSQATAGAQPAFADGPVGGTRCRSFDGGDQFTSGVVGASDLSVCTGEWSIEMFVKPTSVAVFTGLFSINGDAAVDTAATNYMMNMRMNQSNGELALQWEYATGTNYQPTSGAGAVTLGSWQHVAIVKNASNVRFYVAGTYINQTAWTNNAAGGTSARICIGAEYQITGGALNFYQGLMRSVRISSIARSDAEITASAALMSTTAMHVVDAYTYLHFPLSDLQTVPLRRIHPRRAYRMRGYDAALARQVYWNAGLVDSSGVQYPGAGALSDIAVVGAFGNPR